MLKSILSKLFWIVALVANAVLSVELCMFILEYRLANSLPSATGVALGWSMFFMFAFAIFSAFVHSMFFEPEY